jgi:hypothetical protein
MATYYWVYTGTTSANWNTPSYWSTSSGGPGGAVLPTSADDVIFDNNSGPVSASQTIIFQTTSVCRSLTFTSRTRNPITFSDSNYLQIHGDVSLDASSNITFTGGNSYLRLAATSGSFTISSGINLPKLFFDGVGGTWTFASNITCFGSSGSPQQKNIDIANGTVNFSTFTIIANAITSNYTSARTINFNSAAITLKNVSPFPSTNTTNLTVSAGTAVITLDGTVGTGEITLPSGSGVTWPSINVTRTSGSVFAFAATLAGLTIAGPATSGAYVDLSLGGDLTVAGTLQLAGPSVTQRIYVTSDDPDVSTRGVQRTITAAVVSLSNVDFRRITAAGAAAPFTGTSIGDAGGNVSITTSTPKTVYWSNTSGGTWVTNSWAASSGGSPTTSNYPLLQDTAIIDDAGVASGITITLSPAFRIGSVNSLGVTVAKTPVSLNLNGASVFGNLETNEFASLTSSPSITFRGYSTQLLQATFNNSSITVDNNATVSLSGDFLSGSLLNVNNGTFQSNSYYISLSRVTVLSSGALNMGSSTWNITATSGTVWSFNSSASLTSGTSSITLIGVAGITFAGGTKTYNNLQLGIGANTITGSNTFNTLSSQATTSSVTFDAGSTTTVSTFAVSGTSTQTITLASSSTSNFTLSKSSGNVDVEYLSISRSTATGGASWVATKSINGGNNIGWQITGANTGFLFFL